MTIVDTLRQRARDIGFDSVGVCPGSVSPDNERRLRDYLAKGWHGDMLWMESRVEQRADPQQLWPDVRSIIVLGLSYAPAADPLLHHGVADVGVVSAYAQGKDYHQVIKSKLKELARWLIDKHGGDVKVFVDTAPVMEKALAAAAGIGWQGKHTNVVSRDHGSWLFLGAIYTTLELPPDVAHENRCGTCKACQDVCPTQAFPVPYQLDARRCISYLTIEHKGHIPLEFRKPIGNRIYGCDDCLAVCPWNKFAAASREMAFHPRAELIAPRLVDLVMLEDQDFRELFAGSPVKRVGRDRFVRNVLVALGNAHPSEEIIAAVMCRLEDSSALVRAAAVWSLGELLASAPAQLAAAKARFLAQEQELPQPDLQVLAEWQRLLPVLPPHI